MWGWVSEWVCKPAGGRDKCKVRLVVLLLSQLSFFVEGEALSRSAIGCVSARPAVLASGWCGSGVAVHVLRQANKALRGGKHAGELKVHPVALLLRITCLVPGEGVGAGVQSGVFRHGLLS
jgi:hypothetical protein